MWEICRVLYKKRLIEKWEFELSRRFDPNSNGMRDFLDVLRAVLALGGSVGMPQRNLRDRPRYSVYPNGY